MGLQPHSPTLSAAYAYKQYNTSVGDSINDMKTFQVDKQHHPYNDVKMYNLVLRGWTFKLVVNKQ